jgi:osmotically-inducible protein OsmY
VAPGKVRVSGRVETGAQKADAESALRAVKGVEVVENVIEVVPVFRTGV